MAMQRDSVQAASRRYVAPPPSPPAIYLGYIPKGHLGTQRTVEHMKALIRVGARDFYVRQKAIDILLERRVTPKDYVGEIRALFEWVQRHVRYTKDPFQLEVLHSPRRLLELRAGDCDDMSILLGALLEAIGHPVRLVLTGPDPLRPRLFTHVYLEVFHKGRWISLDPTMPHAMGWAPQTFVKRVIPIERRPNMLSQDVQLQGTVTAPTVPDWLLGLIRTIRREAMQPKDRRVKALWNLLRQRQQLGQSLWLRGMLRRIWDRGLTAQPRPRTARRLVRLLRRLGVLPSQVGFRPPLAARPLRARVVRPVRPLRLQPVRPRRLPSAHPAMARR